MRFKDDLAASRIYLDDGTVLTKCDQCIQAYGERNPPQEPPCDICKVELMDKNKAAESVYYLTRRQYVTADQGQVVDISVPAVKIVMGWLKIPPEKELECFLKVKSVFNAVESERRKNES